ncbi:PAS domain-containing sensor histidine kinase [Eisenibacter elegans]|uniref:PAS domain-containing sensor histidine kinase n=1 Tax=Eisenibacter elegans TaxID=997 RepID=UPI000424C27E|nr:HAMP domain-containing sensor histidine kinase [Eisenibacter elegans]
MADISPHSAAEKHIADLLDLAKELETALIVATQAEPEHPAEAPQQHIQDWIRKCRILSYDSFIADPMGNEPLIEQEHYLQGLIESSADMICMLDKYMHVRAFNSLYQAYIVKRYGVTLQVGQNLFEQFAHKPDKVLDWLPVYERTLRGESFKIEKQVQLDNEQKFFEIQFNPVRNTQQEVIGLSYFIKDVSKEKKIEQQLTMQNEELLLVNEELDRFVYSVSHDIKAPLSSVQGIVQLMRLEKDTSQFPQYLALIDKSLKRLDFFIKDITYHSRNARLMVVRQPIHWEELIAEVFENLAFMEHESHNNEVAPKIHINQTVDFFSDRHRLYVIFNNLVSNAIRYAHPERTDPYVSVEIEVNELEARVKVSDNGQGISQEHLDKIFDMFYRASENKSGSGLGLYIVRETIKKLSGDIKVDSVVGEGTTFELRIPNIVQ